MDTTDDEVLKAEIDEIMSRVDTIMDKVARVIPEAKQEADGQG
jgi:tetrahydromethanopterin S-methyltransferase subunit G